MSSDTAVKSNVFLEDLALADGGSETAETGTRRTSTGGTVTLTKIDGSIFNYPHGITVVSYATLDNALARLGSNNGFIHIIKAISIADDYTIPANIRVTVDPGAIITVATTKTLTINGPLEAGPYQIFDCTGTGQVVIGSNTCPVLPEWWYSGTGAYTTALNAAFIAAPDGGTIHLLPKVYSTGPLTCNASVKIRGCIGIQDNTGTARGTTLQAAANQTHILLFGGEDIDNWIYNNELINVTLDANSKTLSDAALIIQYQEFSKYKDVTVGGSYAARAIRFHNAMDITFDPLRLFSIGVDNDCVMYVDEKESTTYTNELHFLPGCQFENNRGSIMKFHTNSFSDNIDFDGVDFERNNATAGNTTNVPMFVLPDVYRFFLRHCHLSNYDDAYQTQLVDFGTGGSRAAAGLQITGNIFSACTLIVTLGTESRSAVIKGNQGSYTETLTLDNSSKYGSVIFEPILTALEAARYELVFKDKRTPFISIADLKGLGAYDLINDASNESLGNTDLLFSKAVAAANSQVAGIPLKQWANYPGAIQIWVRGKTAGAAGGSVYIYLTGTNDYGPGVNTFGASWEWKHYTITQAQLADATVTAGNAQIFIDTSTDTYYFDGIYIVPQETSSQVVAFAVSYDVNLALGLRVRTSDIGTAAAVTVNAPTNPPSPGQEVIFDWTKTTNALTITWNAVFKTSYTSLTADKRVVIKFIWDGTNYVQAGTPAELTP